MAIYHLQLQDGDEWIEIKTSPDRDDVICDGILRREGGDICRVVDHHGAVIWHAHGVDRNKKAGE